MTTTTDIKNNIQRSMQHLKDEAGKLGDAALVAAKDQILDPAYEAVGRAGQYAGEALATTRGALSGQYGQASDLAKESCDRVIGWAKANPLAAIGLAFAAGLVVAKSALTSTTR